MKKEYRLRRNEDFQKIIKKNRNLANYCFAAYFDKNELNQPRIGISVSSKLGKAVLRNKVKRQIKMMVSDVLDLNLGVDIVIIVRKGYLNKKYADNLYELKRLYGKIIKELNKEV